MLELKMLHCFGVPTEVRAGRSPRDYEARKAIYGSLGPGGWACIPSFWIRATPTESLSRFRQPAFFARTTTERPGGRPIAASNPLMNCQTRTRKWGIAFTELLCTHPAP